MYVVHQGAAAQRLAFQVAEALRQDSLSVVVHCGGGSFKAQMKKADGSGALLALVIGEDEAAANEVGIKPLRIEGAQQQRVSLAALAATIENILYNDGDNDEGAGHGGV